MKCEKKQETLSYERDLHVATGRLVAAVMTASLNNPNSNSKTAAPLRRGHDALFGTDRF